MSRIQDTTVIGETAFNVAVFGPKQKPKQRRQRSRNYSSLGQDLVERYEPYPSDIKFAAAVMVKVSLRPERDYTPLLEALGIIPALPVTA